MVLAAGALLLLAAAAAAAAPQQPNPPVWPASVTVFKPSDASQAIEKKVNDVYKLNGGRHDHGQFSPQRAAFLFLPGNYAVDVPVGYYTQVRRRRDGPRSKISCSENRNSRCQGNSRGAARAT